MSSASRNIAGAAELAVDGQGKTMTISGDIKGTGTARVPVFIVKPGTLHRAFEGGKR